MRTEDQITPYDLHQATGSNRISIVRQDDRWIAFCDGKDRVEATTRSEVVRKLSKKALRRHA